MEDGRDSEQTTLKSIRQQLDRVLLILDGSPEAEVKGMRNRLRDLEGAASEMRENSRAFRETFEREKVIERLAAVEKLAEALDEARKQQIWMTRGIMIGLGVTGISSLSGLVLQLLKLATGP